jgi:hypothetical protein
MCSYNDLVRNRICLEAPESSSLRVNGLENQMHRQKEQQACSSWYINNKRRGGGEVKLALGTCYLVKTAGIIMVAVDGED